MKFQSSCLDLQAFCRSRNVVHALTLVPLCLCSRERFTINHTLSRRRLFCLRHSRHLITGGPMTEPIKLVGTDD